MDVARQCLTWTVVACCLNWAWDGAPGDPATPAIPRTAELLRAGNDPVRIVCLGDSVTGVYYHTGGRRAYPEMVQVALKRLYPNASRRRRGAV